VWGTLDQSFWAWMAWVRRLIQIWVYQPSLTVARYHEAHGDGWLGSRWFEWRLIKAFGAGSTKLWLYMGPCGSLWFWFLKHAMGMFVKLWAPNTCMFYVIHNMIVNFIWGWWLTMCCVYGSLLWCTCDKFQSKMLFSMVST